jgi:hypothetical protein
MDSNQIILRDSIVFAVGLVFVAAGLADGLRVFTPLSWWGAAPVGIALWGTAVTLLYRRVQRRLGDPPGETVA